MVIIGNDGRTTWPKFNDLANNKSCGLDGVNAEHLKHCSDRISRCITAVDDIGCTCTYCEKQTSQ